LVAFIVTNLNLENISKMIDLDSRFYENDNFVDIKTTMKRISINPECDIVVMNNQNLVGYLTLLPVSDLVFKKIVNHDLNESEIESSVIPFNHYGKYSCYFSSIIIDKLNYPFYKSEFLVSILKGKIIEFKKRGIFISKIVAKAVTKSGKYFLRKFGFIEYTRNIFILHIKSPNELFFRINFIFKNILIVLFFISKGIMNNTMFTGDIFEYRDPDI